MFLAAFFVQHELNKQQQDMTSQPEAITFGLAFCLGRGLGGVFGWGISSVGGVVGCRTSAANRSGMGMVCGGGEGRGSGGGGGGGWRGQWAGWWRGSRGWNWAGNWSGSGRRGRRGWFRKPGCVDLLHFRENCIELLHVDSELLLHGLPS